jgi:hypothetical protein
VVELVTPAGGATGVACEEDTSWASFFDGLAAERFLRTNESWEFRKKSQVIKRKSRTLYTWSRAFFSSTALEAFWLAECQPQQKYRSGQPEQGVAKLQIGAQK